MRKSVLLSITLVVVLLLSGCGSAQNNPLPTPTITPTPTEEPHTISDYALTPDFVSADSSIPLIEIDSFGDVYTNKLSLDIAIIELLGISWKAPMSGAASVFEYYGIDYDIEKEDGTIKFVSTNDMEEATYIFNGLIVNQFELDYVEYNDEKVISTGSVCFNEDADTVLKYYSDRYGELDGGEEDLIFFVHDDTLYNYSITIIPFSEENVLVFYDWLPVTFYD